MAESLVVFHQNLEEMKRKLFLVSVSLGIPLLKESIDVFLSLLSTSKMYCLNA